MTTEPRYTVKRVAQWVLWQVLFSLLLYFALTGSKGAGNVLCFWAWTGAVLTFFAAGNDEVRLSAKARGRNVPPTLSTLSFLTYSSLLLWHGWWGAGIAIAIEWACLSAIHSKDGKEPA